MAGPTQKTAVKVRPYAVTVRRAALGLSAFLFTVDLTIFKVVTAWIALCVILYACLTFLPYIYKNSPYSTPLSAPVFFGLTGIRYIFIPLFQSFPKMDPSNWMLLRDQWVVYRDVGRIISYSMKETIEKFASKVEPKIDYKILWWTFRQLDEDTDLEKFFERLPRLCDSKKGKDLMVQEGFIIPHKKRLSSALIGLMDRTLPPNLEAESVKQRRMIICMKVVDSTSLLGPWWFLRCVLLGEWSKFLECIEFGLFVQNRMNIPDKFGVTSFYAQCVAAHTIPILRDRICDKRWVQLASGLLNVSKSLLDKYIAHDAAGSDNILLANAILIVRRTVQTYSEADERHRRDILEASSKTLETVCKLKIGGTLPELQHGFCDLWNQLVQMTKTDECPHHVFVAKRTLKNIRKLYIDLHKTSGTPPTADGTTTGNPDSILECARLMTIVLPSRSRTCNSASQILVFLPHPTLCLCPDPAFPFLQIGRRPLPRLSPLLRQLRIRLHQLRLIIGRPLLTHTLIRPLLLRMTQDPFLNHNRPTLMPQAFRVGEMCNHYHRHLLDLPLQHRRSNGVAHLPSTPDLSGGHVQPLRAT
jgi:hypothetical protein